MRSLSARPPTPTSGSIDRYRKKFAIVMNDHEREDRAMARHRVVTVLVDDMTGLEPAIAGEFFGMDRSDDFGVEWYRHAYCTETPGRLRVRGGPDVFVEKG